MVEAIILAHLKYLECVEEFLEGGPEPHLTQPEDCSLGRWYSGEGQELYAHVAEFQEIAPLHRAFHAVTAEAVSLKKEGQITKAREKMNEAYQLFGRIEHLLLDLANLEKNP